MELLLASASPRRRELLASLGFQFTTIKITCDEAFPTGLPAHKVAAYISEQKALAYGPVAPRTLLLTADTVVVAGGRILGKPQNDGEAREMLRLLSGTAHHVHTAVTFRSTEGCTHLSDSAEVSFNKISNQEIEDYLVSGAHRDKAGGYGIQDAFGMAKIRSINGNFYTVMGLPTDLVYNQLLAFGILP